MKFKYILSIYFLFAISSFSQDKKTVINETAIYRKYHTFKKEMYVDNILKEKIPDILYKKYYKNVMLDNYKEELKQQWDTINKIHRLYLYTKNANSGFLAMNKEVSGFMEVLPDSIHFLYIQNQDTIRNFSQVLDLISLKEEDIRNLKYKKDNNTFVVNIVTE